MPSGYTEKLYRGEEQSFPEFAMDCARAFGALIELRDSPKAEIPERFQPSDYHLTKRQEAEDELERWTTMPLDEVAADLRTEQERAAQARQDIVDTATAREARYRAMLAEVEAWQPPSDNHVEFKDYMVNQLTESIRFDCSTSHLPEIPVSDPAEWRQDRIAKAQKDIRYHDEQYAAECERAAERTAWVQALRGALPVQSGAADG
jgi:hypothetical protein